MWVIGVDLCEEFQCRDLCMYIQIIGNTKLLSGKAVKACSSRSPEVVAQPVKGVDSNNHMHVKHFIGTYAQQERVAQPVVTHCCIFWQCK